jgi:hypothetical protein
MDRIFRYKLKEPLLDLQEGTVFNVTISSIINGKRLREENIERIFPILDRSRFYLYVKNIYISFDLLEKYE